MKNFIFGAVEVLIREIPIDILDVLVREEEVS